MTTPYKWRHKFRSHVPRWTWARDAVMELLSQTSKHLSAKEIHDTLLKLYPGIGLSTVYRTLDFLAQMNFVNKIDIGDGQSRYEFKSDDQSQHHHHLICTNCGKIIDYSDFFEKEMALIKGIEKNLSRKYSFKVQDHNIDFYGLCKDCQ